MQTEQLFIPDKIKVGFQKREGTYTGKLAYVIYFDKRGVLRKETSWQSWRDDKIKPVEFENTPTDGFVLNKGVGGARQSYGWNTRNEYIRVYDPRDFEFEISVANLLFILREGDCSRGKGLEGKFVYAWDKNNLVLLPVVSQDYQISTKFTDLQDKSVSAKELVPGASYITKKQESLIFLGRFVKHSYQNSRGHAPEKSTKKYVFWNGKDFVFLNEPKAIAIREGDSIVPNFAELVDKYNNSFYNSKAVELFIKKRRGKNGYWAVKDGDGYLMYQNQHHWDHTTQKQEKVCNSISCHQKVSIDDKGNVCFDYVYKNAFRPGSSSGRGYGDNRDKWIEPTNDRLWIRLESGAEYEVGYNQLIIEEKDETDGED